MVATFREGGLVAWAEASGQRRTSGRAGSGLRFAFYGRVSTEDWQDPVTSRARQREQAGAGPGRAGVLRQPVRVRGAAVRALRCSALDAGSGGRVDFASEHDERTMTMLGLSSKRELTRTSIRVRTAMTVQTREQGQYLGSPAVRVPADCDWRRRGRCCCVVRARERAGKAARRVRLDRAPHPLDG
jgi:site-specific DNA recombinase